MRVRAGVLGWHELRGPPTTGDGRGWRDCNTPVIIAARRGVLQERMRLSPALAIALLAGCNCADVPSPNAPPALTPLPADIAAQLADGPTLYRHPQDGTLWVIGLPPAHGWSRGRRALVTRRFAAADITTKLGVVRVLDGTYPTAARVATEAALPEADFTAATAALVDPDQRPRLGKHYARVVAEPTATTATLDLGADDDVRPGDIYVVRAADTDAPVGRLRVTRVEPTRATATVINPGPITPGLVAIHSPAADPGAAAPAALRIIVCDFMPEAVDDPDVTKAGKAFAFNLATVLKAAAADWSGLAVEHVSEVVTLADGDGHAEARRIGRAHQADLVVWGTTICYADSGCSKPRYTLVDPDRLTRAAAAGPRRDFAPTRIDEALGAADTRPPLVMASALLGWLAFDAQRYRDAIDYLDRALGPDGLTGDDRGRALRDVNQSQFIVGDYESALDTSAELEAQGGGWVGVALDARARVLHRRGHLDEALALCHRALALFPPGSRSRAVTHGSIAAILADRGDYNEALRIHRKERLPIYDRLGDERARAITLGHIADVHVRRGDFDEAMRIHRQEELPVYKRLGDVREHTVTLGRVAHILTRRGEFDEALRILREEVLPVLDSIGDVQQRAIALGKVADILTQRGELDEARRIRRQKQLPIFEELGEDRQCAVTLGKIADIHTRRGEFEEALRIHREEELPVYERLSDVRSRAITLGSIAHILGQQGRLDEALRIHRQEQLPVLESLGDVRQHTIALGQVADVLALQGDVDTALHIYRGKVLPFHEQRGDRREVVVAQANLAQYLIFRGFVQGRPADWAEARMLLAKAHAAAIEMRLPEAATIRGIQQSQGWAPR